MSGYGAKLGANLEAACVSYATRAERAAAAAAEDAERARADVRRRMAAAVAAFNAGDPFGWDAYLEARAEPDY